MKKPLKFVLLGMLSVFLLAGTAMALPFGSDGGSRLQGVLDNITVNPDGSGDWAAQPDGYNSSVDVTTDYLSDESDSIWALTASGSSISTIIIELAGHADQNTFGVYNGSAMYQLFDGSADAGSTVMFGLLAWAPNDYEVQVNGGSTGVHWNTPTFGFYLDGTAASQEVFYSDSSMNSNGFDHMLAFQGVDDRVKLPLRPAGTWTSDEYVLAWEDLTGGGDLDYEDFVVMVESVEPVPEPATMFLFGAGLIGLGVLGRKKMLK